MIGVANQIWKKCAKKPGEKGMEHAYNHWYTVASADFANHAFAGLVRFFICPQSFVGALHLL